MVGAPCRPVARGVNPSPRRRPLPSSPSPRCRRSTLPESERPAGRAAARPFPGDATSQREDGGAARGEQGRRLWIRRHRDRIQLLAAGDKAGARAARWDAEEAERRACWQPDLGRVGRRRDGARVGGATARVLVAGAE
uniref:Uncharacterized protein n=1 Tax=Oryza meridionalis TaxID=40149 RepID=A0A0E0C8V5_9ORYZ